MLTDVVPAPLLNPTVIYASPEVLGRRPGAPYAWDIADLQPGGGGRIQFRATVTADLPPVPYAIANQAQIMGAEPDPDPWNNRAEVRTFVGLEGTTLYLPLVQRAAP